MARALVGCMSMTFEKSSKARLCLEQIGSLALSFSEHPTLRQFAGFLHLKHVDSLTKYTELATLMQIVRPVITGGVDGLIVGWDSLGKLWSPSLDRASKLQDGACPSSRRTHLRL